MRNILEHPITETEIIEFLNRLYEEQLNDNSIGSISPEILKIVIERLTEHNLISHLAGDEILQQKFEAVNNWHENALEEAKNQIKRRIKIFEQDPRNWEIYQITPPPLVRTPSSGLELSKLCNNITSAVLHILIQEGIVAWDGGGVGRIANMIFTQMLDRARLYETLEKIVLDQTLSLEEVRKIACDSISQNLAI